MVRSVVRIVGGIVAVAAVVALASETRLGAQTAGQALGSVTVNRKVMANGQPLAPGTYTLRLLPEEPSKVVGQTPAESRWVEFVHGGKVVGKEVATVLSGPEAKTVAKGKSPAAGSAKAELLKGDDYLRIWINQGGKQYLVHLAVAKS
jgi:hypothetical protein